MDLYSYLQNSVFSQRLEQELQQNHGVRLGESAVVSCNLHGNSLDRPGRITVFTDLDAGYHYLGYEGNNHFIHIDVFHEPAMLDPVYTARGILKSIEFYFSLYRDRHSHEFSVDTASKMTLTLSKNILLKTSCTFTTVFELANGKSLSMPETRLTQYHAHVLMPRPGPHQNTIMYIVDSIERSVLSQGFEIRRVESIQHSEFRNRTAAKTETHLDFDSTTLISTFRQNCLQILLDLSDYFGDLDNVYSFLASLTSPRGLLIRNLDRRMNGGLKQAFEKMIELKLVNERTFTYHLSEHGRFLINFITLHRKELEAQIKRSIRRYKVVNTTIGTHKYSLLKSRKTLLKNTKKSKALGKNSWMSSIAIPETILNASVDKFLNHQPRLSIQKKNIRVLDKRSFAPIDTCICVDCSDSMKGHKIRAVSFLAEHFLLTSREKIGLIGFQNEEARVVLPFTKDHYKLKTAIAAIDPGGMTPLAQGIVESINLIKSKRARNPLLILITDGLPNVPLWSKDAKKDALKAAEAITQNRIRLVCIGLIPNAEFMKDLTTKGNGNLYALNELTKTSLLKIVSSEWKSYKN